MSTKLLCLKLNMLSATFRSLKLLTFIIVKIFLIFYYFMNPVSVANKQNITSIKKGYIRIFFGWKVRFSGMVVSLQI